MSLEKNPAETLPGSSGEASISAYGDGIDAAYRTGRYVNATDCPDCPFLEGTPDFDQWWEGFGYGTDRLIYCDEDVIEDTD